jgi:(R,R)-butanediol dehydrogenase/meso-butanediol dehydrogenase/diacetyl reductase
MRSLCVKGSYTGEMVDGSMTEYLVAPEYTFYKIPDSVPDDIAALTEPLAVAFHGVRKSKLQMGDTVAIVGAGPIGDCVLLAAKAAGASRIFVLEYSKMRREVALSFGASAVLNPADGDPVAKIWDLTDGLGADVTLNALVIGIHHLSPSNALAEPEP